MQTQRKRKAEVNMSPETQQLLKDERVSLQARTTYYDKGVVKYDKVLNAYMGYDFMQNFIAVLWPLLIYQFDKLKLLFLELRGVFIGQRVFRF